jgi:hypothetical protein
MMASLSQAEAGTVMAALGDSLVNRLRWVATGGGTINETDLFTMIRAANTAERRTTEQTSDLMTALRGALTPLSFWKARLLLVYGNETAFPPVVTTLVTLLQGTPAAAAIQTYLSRLSEVEYPLIRDLPGIREVMRALVTDDAAYNLIRRYLEQGLISEEANVTGSYTEHILTEPPGTAAGTTFLDQTFNGTRGFDVAYYRDHLQVTVRIALAAQDTTANAEQGARSAEWKTWIESAWDNQYNLRNPSTSLPIRVSCEFTSSNPHHTVSIYSATTGPGWPTGYNMTNWYYKNSAYSSRAMVHEFGHMLGNPDEYDQSQANFTARVGAPVTSGAGTNATVRHDTPTAAHPVAQDTYSATNSVMNQGDEPVQARHFDYFRDWINAHRRQNATGAPAEPAFTVN